MPNRLIREGLMESEAVLTVPVEARWLYVVIMLSADDLGLFEATEFKLARRADVRRELASKLMQMLADVDLIRFYEVGDKRFGFIPRFRQRLQIQRSKHPLPPLALVQDDLDALNKINELASKTTVGHLLRTGGKPPEPEPEPEEEDIPPSVASLPTGVVATARAAATYKPPACPTKELVALYHSHLPALPAVEVLNDGRKRAIATRWREVCADGKLSRQQGIEWFAWFFAHVAKSDFLMGRVQGKSGRTWTATFDFLTTPSKFARVVEGAYHGAKA
jgi:hypothetical protein